MVLKALRMALTLAVVLVVWNLGFDSNTSAQAWSAYGPAPFANYWVAPDSTGVGANLYPCPRPTPPVVGQTWITYQPLMPHEFLYKHHRCYHRRHPGGGRTKTLVWWE